jgi:hypothetical protein
MSTTSTPAQILDHLMSGATGTSREIADALGRDPKKVSSALSRMAKAGIVAKDGNNFFYDGPETAEETVSEPEQAEPVAAEAPADEATEETVSEPEPVFTGVIDFPGNYSIAFAPGAVRIAEAAGVRTKVVNVPGRLNRKVYFEDGEMADAVVAFINQNVPAVLAGLKAWQKENIESRRGLTDMQKYLQHREYITIEMNRLAGFITESGVGA